MRQKSVQFNWTRLMKNVKDKEALYTLRGWKKYGPLELDHKNESLITFYFRYADPPCLMVVKELISVTTPAIDINHANQSGETALLTAIANLETPLTVFEALIEAGADPLKAKNKYGTIPL